jgi:hypothetical protein
LNSQESALCRALGIAKTGKVYGSRVYGNLFCYDPSTNKVMRLKSSLPCVRNRDLTNHVQSWVLAEDGKLYGGTTLDGFLFQLDPENDEVVNLGKPTHAGNVRSLFIKDSTIHGLVGHGYEYTHYFTFDLRKKGFKDNGIFWFRNTLINSRHRTFTASEILPLKDGRIMVAEDDLLPMLLFCVQ